MFFEKDTSLELLENTLVSYLSFDYNGFTPNVDYVFPLSSLVVHRDTRGTQRADNVYHDDETWRLINEGKPYVDFESGRNCVIYYPIIQDDTCTIWEGLLGNGIYVSKHTEWLIFEMYNELIQIDYKGWPTITEVAYAICRFKKQIEAINAYEEIDRYQIISHIYSLRKERIFSLTTTRHIVMGILVVCTSWRKRPRKHASMPKMNTQRRNTLPF